MQSVTHIVKINEFVDTLISVYKINFKEFLWLSGVNEFQPSRLVSASNSIASASL